jgi:uncharacterized protein
MTLSLDDTCGPALIRGLENMAYQFGKGRASVRETGMDQAELVQARLAPDMQIFAGQGQRVPLGKPDFLRGTSQG